MTPTSILSDLPRGSESEHFLTLFESEGVRVERIVSHRYASPEGFWYDQSDEEWVLLLKGEAVLEFEGGERVTLKAGDALLIAKHRKHRVEQTSDETVWLAVHAKTTER